MHPTVSDRVQGHDRVPGLAFGPTLEELEDVLYDILATGVAPTAKPGALEAVQVLVHEHARAKKSLAELLAFFEDQGLTLISTRSAPPLMSPLPAEDPAAISGMAPLYADSLAPSRKPAAVSSSMPLWLAISCAAIVLLAVAAAGYIALERMNAELARVHTQSAAQAAELATVKSEAATLRHSVQENSALVRQVDHKSDVLIQSLLSPLDPANVTPAK